MKPIYIVPLENSYLSILSLAHPFCLPIYVSVEVCVRYSGHGIAILGLRLGDSLTASPQQPLVLDPHGGACPVTAIKLSYCMERIPQ
jgi:hypothetical protein